MLGIKYGNDQYFNPRKLSGLLLWLDATDPNGDGTQPSSGIALLTWVDKSRNGYNATQATGSAQPLFVTNQLNGRPAIQFDGSNHWIRVESTALAQAITTDMTMFVVLKYGAVVAGSNNFVCGTDPQANPPRATFLTNTVAVTDVFDWNIVPGGRISQATGSTGTPYIYTCVASVSNNTQEMIRNTTSLGTKGSAATNSFSTTYKWGIGAHDNGTLNKLNGSIGEIIICNSYYSATNRAIIYNYLKNKWGI